MRYLIFIIVFCLCTSCDYLSFKKNKNIEKLDTIVNTKEVDMFPSFKACDSIIDKVKKADCFRRIIHQEIAQNLSSQTIKVKRPVDETIKVIITVPANGIIVLKTIEASESLHKEIPDLRKIIEKSIADLPKVYPARKQGILVTSEYILPIRVKL